VAEILSAVLYARIADPLQHAPYLSRGFALVLRKCLTRDRANRYATPAELLADLERVRERRSPNVAKARLDPVLRDWRPARRPAIAAAAAVAAVALGWTAVATFGRVPKPDAAATDPPKSPDPIRAFESAVDGPVDRLTGAYAAAHLLETSGSVPPGSQTRLAESKRRLERRIADEVESFERAADVAFEASLASRDFLECERRIEGGYASDLAARLGPARLPPSVQAGFDAWIRGRSARFTEERDAALAKLGPALGAHVKAKTLPSVDDLVARGDWNAARELLTFDPKKLAREAGIPLAGLSDAEVARATESVRAVVAERRARLDEAWGKLDGELGAWVEGRVGALRDALVDRTLRDAPARLRADWERELGARGLAVDRMPIGVARTANEAVARGEQTLGEVERKVADEDAHLRLAELEGAAAPLWRERRYGEIEKLYGDAGGESWSAAFRDRVDLPETEARRLDGLLRRAADGVQKKKDQPVTLQLGTLAFTGRLVATSDPMLFPDPPGAGAGAHVRDPGAVDDASAPAGPCARGARGSLEPRRRRPLGPRARRALPLEGGRAGERGGGACGPGRARQRPARARRPAPRGARASHRDGARGRGEAGRAEARARRGEAPAPPRETAGREKKLKRIEELLQQYTADLAPEELAEVRNLRAELTLEATPSKLEDFVEAFRLPADRIEIAPPPKSRATLRFEFAAGRPSGTFERGEWLADREGWVADRPAQSDEEMLARAAPTLVLKDPLRVQKETFEIVLRFEQPGDAPPNLLLVSAAGIQVALVGTRRPRCLVRTGDAATAVAHAREDDGRSSRASTAARRTR
jgi:hypothetical protein